LYVKLIFSDALAFADRYGGGKPTITPQNKEGKKISKEKKRGISSLQGI
jgi:hypothetical protein